MLSRDDVRHYQKVVVLRCTGELMQEIDNAIQPFCHSVRVQKRRGLSVPTALQKESISL